MSRYDLRLTQIAYTLSVDTGDSVDSSTFVAQSVPWSMISGAPNQIAGLAAINDETGLLEQTAPDTFVTRAVGVEGADDVPTRADSDTRYGGFASLAAFVVWAATATVSPGHVTHVAGVAVTYHGPSFTLGLPDAERWWPSEATPALFGAPLNGVDDDSVGINACSDWCAFMRNANLAYPIVRHAMTLPPAIYTIASGQSARVSRGLRKAGASRSSAIFIHGGGNVPCVIFDDLQSSNTNVEVVDMTIQGAGAGTTYGIFADGNVRNGIFRYVTVLDCNIGIGGDTCYTLAVEHCDIQRSVKNNVQFSGVTSSDFSYNRIDEAGECNIVIQGLAGAPVVHVNFTHGHYQRAGQAGIRLIDVDSAVILNPYFEGNNQDSGGFGDIEWLHGPLSRGRDLTVIGMFGTATSGGTDTRNIIADTAGRLTVVSPKTYIGSAPGHYAVGIDLGASMYSCEVFGGWIDADTRIVAASASTIIRDAEGLLENLVSSSNIVKTLRASNNFKMVQDAPANRRNELVLSAGGVEKVFFGRRDSDDSHPGSAYIGRTSGGGANPDFLIDASTGVALFQRLTMLGPFANDAAADAGGVGIGGTYLKDGGTVAWRVS